MKPRVPSSLPVPGSRLSRLMRFGSLASRVGGGMVAEGARQLVHGKRPLLSELLLTSGNVHRMRCLKWSVKGGEFLGTSLQSDDAKAIAEA